jgi:hypothetical protein
LKTPEESNRITLKNLKVITYLALIIALTDTVFVAVLATQVVNNNRGSSGVTTTTDLGFIKVTGPVITPPTSLATAPVITTLEPFGARLTDINQPFNSSELSVINNASNSFFETAGEMYLNGTLQNTIGTQPALTPVLQLNGRPTVIYLGAISCQFCGENRWAMAMALSRFGGFSQLFKGYSSFNDHDLPTIYWAPANYNASSDVEFGNFYTSNYIYFLSTEYSSPITGGFQMQSLSYFELKSTAINNSAYEKSIALIGTLNNYQGTPYTIWGKWVVNGVDAIDFGNSTNATSGIHFPLTNTTHAQVLEQFANPNDQFAWTEYAAADLYLALLCSSTANAVSACHLPAIVQIEAKGGIG